VVAEELLELRVHWQNGHLRVLDRYRGEHNIVGRVAAALTGLWRFVSFSESRWLTFGASTKTLIAAELTGLSNLVSRIRRDKKASDYYIGGHQKLTPGIMTVCAIAALGCGVAESMMANLFQDDRVVLRLPILRQVLTDELDVVAHIPEAIFERVAGITGASSLHLRSCVVIAADSSAAFINMKIFREAARYPWCLAGEDMDEQLDILHAGDMPLEPTAGKIWRLIEGGWPRARFI
jgi:hypothetical protein